MVAGEGDSGIGRNLYLLEPLDVQMDVQRLGALGAELYALVALDEELIEEIFVYEALDPVNEPLGKLFPGKFLGNYLVDMDAVFRMQFCHVRRF